MSEIGNEVLTMKNISDNNIVNRIPAGSGSDDSAETEEENEPWTVYRKIRSFY